MTRLAVHAAVILGAMFPLTVCGEIDPAALLNQARAKIVENVEKLPKYTCVRTVRRSRFEAVPAVRVSNCGDVQDSKIEPRLTLAWTDRFKLDVTVSEGAEIFSWVGARRFQSEEVEKIVGGGMTGTGDFGPFLMSIFSQRVGVPVSRPRARQGASLRRVPLSRAGCGQSLPGESGPPAARPGDHGL